MHFFKCLINVLWAGGGGRWGRLAITFNKFVCDIFICHFLQICFDNLFCEFVFNPVCTIYLSNSVCPTVKSVLNPC